MRIFRRKRRQFPLMNSRLKIVRRDRKKISHLITWIAVKAATIAGLPNPCDMREKWVRCLCILGSRICCGRVLQSGDLSWFRRSISSLVICLETTKSHKSIMRFLPWQYEREYFLSKPISLIFNNYYLILKWITNYYTTLLSMPE